MPVTGNDKNIDLSKLGFTEVQTHDDDLSKFGFTEVKKKVGGSNLSVGQNGQLQKSVPSVSVPQSTSKNAFENVPEFHVQPIQQVNQPNVLSTPTELSKGQQSASENTDIAKVPEINTKNLGFQKAEDKKLQEQNLKFKDAAIDNTVQKSLKLKGIKAQPGSLLYNIEKSKYTQQVDDGNAAIGTGKNGQPGLFQNEKWYSTFGSHMMDAINENKDSREFHSMDDADKIKYLNNLQKDQNEYIGRSSNAVGSVLGVAGGAAPTLGLYGAGALGGTLFGTEAAPVMKPVMSFVMNASSEANKSELQGITQRYFEAKQKNPSISDEEALAQAKKGSDVDRLAGYGTAALFSSVGGENDLLGKSVTGKIIKKVMSVPKVVGEGTASTALGNFGKAAIESGLGLGEKTAAIEGLKDIGHNAEGVTNKSGSDIVNDMGKVFKETAPVGVLLHGVMGAITGITKVPNLLKSTLKYDAVTKINPDVIKAELDKNIQSGAITPEDAQKAENDLSEFSNVLKTVPKDLSDEAKASATGLIIKRNNIAKESEGLDKSAQDLAKIQTDAIDSQLKELYRTGKPLQVEINPATADTYEEPTYDDVQKQRVQNVADKIAKGKPVEDAEDLRAEQQFPDELKSELEKIKKSETPKEDETQSDTFKNVNKYLEKSKANEVQQPTETKSTPTETTTETSLPTTESKTEPKSSNESRREDIMNMLVDMKDSSFDYRITDELSQKDREKGVSDLRNGIDSAAARKVKSLVDNIVNSGEIPIHRGKGGHTEKFNIPFKDWFGEPLTQEELHHAANLSDDAVNIINNEGITKENIDNLKHLFNESGFPYTTDDFNNIKTYLSREGEGNAENKNPIEIGKTEQTVGKEGEQIQSQNKNNENAIQEQSTGGILQHPQEAIGETGGERQRMESGIEGNVPPTEGKAQTETSGEEKVTGVKKAITEPLRTELGLPKVEIPKMGEDAEVLNEAKKRVDSGESNPRDLVDRILSKGEGYKNENDVMDMQYYAHQLQAHADDLAKQISEADSPEAKADLSGKLQQLSDESDRQTEAALIAGNQWGRIGNRMQIVVDGGFNPSREKTFIKDAYGGEIPKDIKEKFDAIKKERDDAIAEKLAIEEKLKQRAAKQGVEKIKKQAEKTARRDETKEKLKEEEKQLLEEIKKSIKKDFGTLNAGIPFPKETIETLGKLAVNYFKQGALTVEALVDKMYNALKEDIEGIDKKQIREIIANYEPLTIERETSRLNKKANALEDKIIPPTVKTEKGQIAGVNEPTDFSVKSKQKLEFRKNTEWVKAQQRVANAEYKIKVLKRQAFESKKNFYQKGLMWANRMFRLSVLSGVNVLYKLSAAASIGGAGMRIPSESIGGIWSGIFKSISEKAPIEGGINAMAEVKFMKDFFNPVKFAQNAWEILKSGQSNLSKRLGGGAQYEHVPILYIPTDLHQIIKDPVKRAVFEASMQKSINWAEKNGLDINDNLVYQSLENAAYKRANYEIFQESNALARKFQKMKSDLDKSGNVGATGKFLVDFMIPVSTVPTNIVRRVITTSPLGLARGFLMARDAYAKGIEKLTPEQADKVMRQLKQGSLGTALYLTGWFAASNLGGLYSKFNPNKRRQEGDLKSDQMEVNGVMIPKPIQHALPFEIMQMAATARHVYDNYTKHSNDSKFEAIYNAGLSSIGALLEQVPVVETGVHAIEATSDPYEAKKLKEDALRRFEPQILRETGVIQKETKGSGGGAGASGGLKMPKLPSLKKLK